MYLGRIVEQSTTEEIFGNPLHPYTQALLSSVPSMEPGERKKRQTLPGDVPSPLHPPSGCAFHPRCPEAMEVCRRETPRMIAKSGEHFVACHLYTIDTARPGSAQARLRK
jgi:peptide/nickel transport system ATP-binding protein/oligopeptide transport system ATP-binding protein